MKKEALDHIVVMRKATKQEFAGMARVVLNSYKEYSKSMPGKAFTNYLDSIRTTLLEDKSVERHLALYPYGYRPSGCLLQSHGQFDGG